MSGDFASPLVSLFQQPLNPQGVSVNPHPGYGLPLTPFGATPIAAAISLPVGLASTIVTPSGLQYAPRAISADGNFRGTVLSAAIVANTITPTVFSFFGLVGGTANESIDVGVYDTNFRKIWSRGAASFVSGVARAHEYTVNISDGSPGGFYLTPGKYFLALGFKTNVGAGNVPQLSYTTVPVPAQHSYQILGTGASNDNGAPLSDTFTGLTDVGPDPAGTSTPAYSGTYFFSLK